MTKREQEIGKSRHARAEGVVERERAIGSGGFV